MTEKWDNHFLELARVHSLISKDPSSKIGAVIVGPDREIRSAGYNGFPRGIKDTEERLNSREEKYRIVVHAECNAILGAARVGTPLKDCTLYLSSPFGGAPCTRCTVEIIQAGIKEVVGHTGNCPDRWKDDLEYSKSILKEAEIVYREIRLND